MLAYCESEANVLMVPRGPKGSLSWCRAGEATCVDQDTDQRTEGAEPGHAWALLSPPPLNGSLQGGRRTA